MLIKELQKHITNDNVKYIEELTDIIIDEKIHSLDDLKKYEDNFYKNSNGEYLSIDERVQSCIDVIDRNPFEYDGLLYEQIKNLKSERKLIDDEIMENKLLHIIKYYYLTNRDNPFPYFTYHLITNNKI